MLRLVYIAAVFWLFWVGASEDCWDPVVDLPASRKADDDDDVLMCQAPRPSSRAESTLHHPELGAERAGQGKRNAGQRNHVAAGRHQAKPSRVAGPLTTARDHNYYFHQNAIFPSPAPLFSSPLPSILPSLLSSPLLFSTPLRYSDLGILA